MMRQHSFKRHLRALLPLLLAAALLLTALPAFALSDSSSYITDADGCWYIETEEGLRPIGSADPTATLSNKLTLSAPKKLTAAVSGGMVRLSWSGTDGASTYSVYRGTAEKQGTLIGIVYASGAEFSEGNGYWFYDMQPNTGSTTTYRVVALDKDEQTLATQSVKAAIPTQSGPKRKGTDSKVQSGSYKNGVLSLSPLPVTGIPYNVYVGVSTRSGRIVLGTTADNIVTEYDNQKNVATSTFRNPLMKGKYTATVSVNIWDSGINFTNPYTMLKCTFDFIVK